MSTRSSIFVLATIAAIGVAALAPTNACAHPVMGVVVQHPVMGVVVQHPILGVIIRPPHPILGVVIHPPGIFVNPDPPHVWWHHHHAPWLIADGDSTRVVATTPAGPCNCLIKKYLDDGSVLFKDVCTKEAAMATPDELKAQLRGAGP
jgi:hypothetical protein